MIIIKKNQGLTLIELLVTTAIIGIILFLATPSMQGMLEKTRLKGAADKLHADLRYARSVAILKNQPIYIVFKNSETQWCYGMTTQPDCDCTQADACQIDNRTWITSQENFRNIQLFRAKFGRNSTAVFEPKRGTTQVNNGTAWFQSPQNQHIAIKISPLGRIRSCSPEVTGYKKCDLPV